VGRGEDHAAHGVVVAGRGERGEELVEDVV